MSGRNWPQVVGLNGEEANAIILADMPNAKVDILP
jgi:hypothetical protein